MKCFLTSAIKLRKILNVHQSLFVYFKLPIIGCLFFCGFFLGALIHADELETVFQHPPAAARPQVYWFWMGSNVSSNGITRDLESLKAEGFGGTTMCSLADVCTPWAGIISNSPSPGIIEYESESWWNLVRHAASESRRLGLEFGIHNCAGYETSGGTWITPELSMQEVVWSETHVTGPTKFNADLPRPQVDPRANQPFPVYNPNGKLEKPIVPGRTNYFRDIAVVALPASGIAPKEKVLNLCAQMDANGHLTCEIPAGDWIIYRFGHTTMGAMLQPCQWDALGLECDKMSREAVEFHMRHLLGELKNHLGDLAGNGLKYIWFDSYEAGDPTWTPKMREEFQARRGYDLTPFLATLAKRQIGSAEETKKFQEDFQQTIHDLYRDVYFATIQRECHAAGLECRSEPYVGPWNISEVIPFFDQVSGEFWTHGGKYSPWYLAEVVAGARANGANLISSEAFTGDPRESQWNETPEWLKPIGDAAFCDGVNRFMLHRFVHQPFDDRWKPGLAMGQWGTHFDRTQTWWKPGKAWVKYLQRCDALLQWGEVATNKTVFSATEISGKIRVRAAQRQKDGEDVFFVANLSRTNGAAKCSFNVAGKQPELWNPVTGEKRDLDEFEIENGRTILPLEFAAAESCFIVFRKEISSLTNSLASASQNFPAQKTVAEISGDWQISFDPKWGGPKNVTFTNLDDWTQRAEDGIKFFSGTATYLKTFDLPKLETKSRKPEMFLDLGTVHALAEVWLNGKNLGVIWTAPWRVDISSAVKKKNNRLEIKVTNVWANRLIGDEQQPADMIFGKGEFGFGGPLKIFPDWFLKNQPRPSPGRFTFSTWNYFTKDSPLISSGLLGPVKLLEVE
jgi:hypothetical protein